MAELKYYQCIKQVHAEPMNWGQFATQVKGRQDIGKMDWFAPGYHVVYNKDTPEEYHSWSPKDVFDVGYVEIPEAVQ